jgi:hypothetical protein
MSRKVKVKLSFHGVLAESLASLAGANQSLQAFSLVLACLYFYIEARRLMIFS